MGVVVIVSTSYNYHSGRSHHCG